MRTLAQTPQPALQHCPEGLHIGTSGWSYDEWRRIFYPDRLASKNRLAYYAERFETVEVNASFYRLPSIDTVANWARQTPPDFTFAVKISRYITHIRRLADVDESLALFFEHLEPLRQEKKLGPVLVQLPPSFHRNDDLLADFSGRLPRGCDFVFEFRHPSWFAEPVYRLLDAGGHGVCHSDLPGQALPDRNTGGIVYYRLHGPEKKYQGSYSARRLGQLARHFTRWLEQDKRVYCYFDNTMYGDALEDARQLIERCRR